MYWYIQYPGHPPKFLLRGYGNVQGFHATHHAGKKNGTYNLVKDARGSTGQSVKQTSGIAAVAEEQTISLNCSYEVQYSGMNYPFWYTQYPGQPPKLLLTKFNKSAQGFQSTQLENDKKGTFNMLKQAIQLDDSAVYFCAFTDTMSGSRGGVNQKQEEKK
ncbi:hypothetical protein L345_17660, partial [Ophiophagus hannah]